MQGAPCAGGAAPPQNGSNAVAEPLSGVQARTLVRPNICGNFGFGSFTKRKNALGRAHGVKIALGVRAPARR